MTLQCHCVCVVTSLPPANEVCEGYVLTGVCLSTGRACMVAPGGHAWLLGGGMHGCSGGHAWLLQGGVCGCSGGGGCMCGCSQGGHAWAPVHGCSWGGVHGCWGGCVVAQGGACVVFSMRYGQWAGGTHPTGMHSCSLCNDMIWCSFNNVTHAYVDAFPVIFNPEAPCWATWYKLVVFSDCSMFHSVKISRDHTCYQNITPRVCTTSLKRQWRTLVSRPPFNLLSCGFWMAQYEDEFPTRVRVSGHLRTLIRSVGHLRLKVWRCPETRPRAGNSSSNWGV